MVKILTSEMQSFLKHTQENKLYVLIKLHVLKIPQYLRFTKKYRYCYVKQKNIFLVIHWNPISPQLFQDG